MRVAGLFGRQSRVRRVERVWDPRDADIRVLEALRELGCDPAEPRGVRHFVYLPDRRAAAELSDALVREDWHTSLEEEEDGVCLVVAARTQPLLEPLVRQTRTRLETLAAEHGGRYDGWEVDTG
jgi:hypothetical protein